MATEELLNTVIDELALPDLARNLVRSRWLDQVQWMEAAAARHQSRYYITRVAAIVLGAAVPALIGLGVNPWITAGLSFIVTVATSLEAFFHYGERWRHYRQTVEALKVEGYQFFQLCGPYKNFADHAEGYAEFAGRVEDILQKEVDGFINKAASERVAAGAVTER